MTNKHNLETMANKPNAETPKTERAENKIDNLVDTSLTKLKQAAKETQKYYDETSEEFTKRIDETGTYISKNPLKSALIATGIGVIIGMLVKK